MARYIESTQVAKMIRTSLKEAYPGVKFSVVTRKYAGGASIDVRWKDGPSTAQVNDIIHRYSGGYFDGMQDLKENYVHQLGDEEVLFGADFIFANREFSRALVQKACYLVYSKYKGNFEDSNIPAPTPERYFDGTLLKYKLKGLHTNGLQSVATDVQDTLNGMTEFLSGPIRTVEADRVKVLRKC